MNRNLKRNNIRKCTQMKKKQNKKKHIFNIFAVSCIFIITAKLIFAIQQNLMR